MRAEVRQADMNSRDKERLDQVDQCMKILGISLNLLDPDGTFKGMPSEETLIKIMTAVREDYRKLSDAILALRKDIRPVKAPPWAQNGEPWEIE